MIPATNLEIRLIVYLIAYGIAYLFLNDIVSEIYKSFIKKWKKIVCLLSYFIFVVVITHYYIENLQDGFIPELFIIFITIGLLIYYLFLRKTSKLLINKIKEFYLINNKKIKKILIRLLYSPTLIIIIRKRWENYYQKLKKSNKKQK